MADIMIDIESLDTGPDCVILTIGAVLFDPKGVGIIERLELRPTIEVDPSLIGGVRVQVGDEVLDSTVKAQLATMQASLSA